MIFTDPGFAAQPALYGSLNKYEAATYVFVVIAAPIPLLNERTRAMIDIFAADVALC